MVIDIRNTDFHDNNYNDYWFFNWNEVVKLINSIEIDTTTGLYWYMYTYSV